MIREDYILAWIRRYVRWLAEIAGLIQRDQRQAAFRRIDQALRNLLDLGADSVTRLTEGEVLARLALGEPGELVQEKCAVLAIALKHLGTIQAQEQRPAQSRDCLLLALHLVLGLKLGGEPPALGEHLPPVDELVAALRPHALSARTYATLILYYERQGQFGRAEDVLFDWLDQASDPADALTVGEGFYGRLRLLSDEALGTGELPRAELEAGLGELQRRARAPGLQA